MSERTIVEVAAVDCEVIDAGWSFATDEATAIDAHWSRRTAGNPHLFNGRVMLLHHGEVERDEAGSAAFRGACFETDFKAFMAWREFGFPPTDVRNIFSMAAIETEDGGFVLGEMAAHTAPAGQIYFPSGTPDRSDVRGGRVDIEGSALRELAEETGLGPTDIEPVPGLVLVMDRFRVCCMKRMRAAATAEVLVARIHDWLAAEAHPELTRMHIVREVGGIPTAVPDFVADYLRHMIVRREAYCG